MESFQQQIVRQKNELLLLEKTKEMPGWNYCNYFLVKEGLSFTYQRAKLQKLAVPLYEELETLFFKKSSM